MQAWKNTAMNSENSLKIIFESNMTNYNLITVAKYNSQHKD